MELDRDEALLLVIDVQEKLAAAMQPEPRARLEKNVEVLIRAARRLGLPIVATEQYPKGLGHIVPSLRELLDEPMEKMEFSSIRFLMASFPSIATPSLPLNWMTLPKS